MSGAVEIGTFNAEDFDGVGALWEDCFPDDPSWNRAVVAIPAKLAVKDHLFFVARAQGRVCGTIMAGYDGHRGWLYALAVSSAYRRKGLGGALVRHAEEALAKCGCLKVNLQIRAGNAAVTSFYAALGYAEEARISMGKRIG